MKLNVLKIREFSGHNDSIYRLVKTGDETFLSSSGEGWVVEWHLNDEEGKMKARFPGSVFALEILPDLNLILAGLNTKQLFVLNTIENKAEKEIILSNDVYHFQYLPVHNTFMALLANGEMMLFSLPGFEIVKTLQPSTANARTAKLIDENTIAIGFSDCYIRIFSLPELELIHEFKAHGNSVFALEYLSREKMLLSGGRDAKLKIWQKELEWENLMDIPAHMQTINNISLQPKAELFATASRDKTIKIWNASTLELLKVIDKDRYEGHFHSVNTLMWMDDETLLSAGDDRRIIQWKIT